MVKVLPWQWPSSAPAPSQGAPDGAGQLYLIRGGAEPLDTQPLPRVLAPAVSKVVNSTAFDHPGAAASVISSALAFLRTRVSSPRDMSGAAAAQLRAACAVEASMAYDRLGYN